MKVRIPSDAGNDKARRPRVVLGQLSFGEALAEICGTLTGCVDPVAIQRICEQRIREKAIAFAQVDKEVTALIAQLRGQGLGLAVVSNCFAEDVHAWSTWPLAGAEQAGLRAFRARWFLSRWPDARRADGSDIGLESSQDVLKAVAAG